MPRDGSETKRRIVETAYELFYKGGFARTGLDAIAEVAGVTKRTFYYHFDSKDTLIAAVLEQQHTLALERIRRWADNATGAPDNVVKTLFAEFMKWADVPRWRGSGITRAAMEYADSPGHPARLAARRHKLAVENLFAERFATSCIRDAKKLAKQIVLLLEGCHVSVLIHGDTTYVSAALEAALTLVREQQEQL